MPTVNDMQSFLGNEFLKVGAEVKVKLSSVEVNFGDVCHEYKFPEPLNQKFLPGWFAAGMWDDMKLPSLHDLPDSQVMEGWLFTRAEGTNYRKVLSGDKLLIYNSANNMLFIQTIQNFVSSSLAEVGPYPTKSIFHALKLFEENSFFSELGEEPVVSLEISDYRIR